MQIQLNLQACVKQVTNVEHLCKTSAGLGCLKAIKPQQNIKKQRKQNKTKNTSDFV